MTKLKLSAIPDDKPVKITVELPAEVFQDCRLRRLTVAVSITCCLPVEFALNRCTGALSPFMNIGVNSPYRYQAVCDCLGTISSCEMTPASMWRGLTLSGMMFKFAYSIRYN
ncbi:DUF2274 domain-containing protein [Brucella intermedia]|uniref:DUF2274 domain-containing protein n=4 Tax=Brucella TaxID=234 RepID=A0ABR6ATU0_9HYPH|nr:Hypothetical protein OINT_2001830 [Brucella intermedia LMG 3301]ELT49252.1 hypothetical protein D584_10777 [Brucella intermedia M86]KAB2670082.1 DUF2274 domain-containing protein [Ochrobactrum sp. LMG 5442]KAB2692939.1 DUF2274 domain-containing protein [Brucella intermedia]MBB3217334.1 hypothetical protein [Ochrobactrum sp. RC6B]NKC28704.1 DUF2274 domain-containing protein [Brucella ciceri]PJT27745.1 DUF2274 domain-containing protein [Ochrobactrum sp. 30A/1000/2015]PJT40572.1 DUF2274 doma